MKKLREITLALIITGICVYMFWNFNYPTPPALSGIAFILIGINLWIPNCPVLNYFCSLKK